MVAVSQLAATLVIVALTAAGLDVAAAIVLMTLPVVAVVMVGVHRGSAAPA
ncbi:MAG TPA: hypothetical protein VLR26_00225 [Frankiaceae bacterium]|nr:hypothetical protein [Frankiaceae bacterium]